MIISVVNHTNMPDLRIERAIRAINRQIAEDFEPRWSMGAALRLEGRITENPDLRLMAANMRGDAIIYIEDDFDACDPLGFHNRNHQGIPFGFVYTGLAEALQEPWEVTFSHEALELLADPEVNLLVMGPHPDQPTRDVFHWYEMCDAVQAEHYEIDGVPLSNFVLPLYFTGGDELGGRNDFLGSALQSFGVNTGGYVGFFDPTTGDHDTAFADDSARNRAALKARYGSARRANRYKRKGTQHPSRKVA